MTKVTKIVVKTGSYAQKERMSRVFKKLPKTSGVYLFYSKSTILYIGKAINIQNRVKNHFQSPTFKDNLFIKKIDKIGFINTNSEIEALILEANLIKKHQPKFNQMWRDDKKYFYVAIAKTEKPIVYITHQKKDNAEYIGPFIEGKAIKKTLRLLRKTFPYYTQKTHLKNKCTWCHLDLCPGPELFENPPSPEATARLKKYKKDIKKLILVLEGKRINVLNSLKKEMKTFSKNKKFEEAGRIRDQIFSLKKIMEHSKIIEDRTSLKDDWKKASQVLAGILDINKIERIECYDISNIQGKHAVGSMVVFSDGIADKSQYKKFKIKMENKPNDIAMLKEILQRRFLHKEWGLPEIILIDGGKAQLNVAIANKKYKNIKVLSLAKRNKELFVEGRTKPILLKSLPREIYNLILQLDDEAHRFAITYHKKIRKRELLK